MQGEVLGSHIHYCGLDLGLHPSRSLAQQIQMGQVAVGMYLTGVPNPLVQFILMLWKD